MGYPENQTGRARRRGIHPTQLLDLLFGGGGPGFPTGFGAGIPRLFEGLFDQIEVKALKNRSQVAQHPQLNGVLRHLLEEEDAASGDREDPFGAQTAHLRFEALNEILSTAVNVSELQKGIFQPAIDAAPDSIEADIVRVVQRAHEELRTLFVALDKSHQKEVADRQAEAEAEAVRQQAEAEAKAREEQAAQLEHQAQELENRAEEVRNGAATVPQLQDRCASGTCG